MSQGKDKDEFLQSLQRGLQHQKIILELETRLMDAPDRDREVLDYLAEILRDAGMNVRELPTEVIQECWDETDQRMGSHLYSLLDETDAQEWKNLYDQDAPREQLWEYFQYHIVEFWEEMAKILYFYRLEYLEEAHQENEENIVDVDFITNELKKDFYQTLAMFMNMLIEDIKDKIIDEEETFKQLSEQSKEALHLHLYALLSDKDAKALVLNSMQQADDPFTFYKEHIPNFEEEVAKALFEFRDKVRTVYAS